LACEKHLKSDISHIGSFHADSGRAEKTEVRPSKEGELKSMKAMDLLNQN
jgi:hypothetical protein